MMDTEKRNPKTKHIDRAGTMEIVKLISHNDSEALLENADFSIPAAIENYKA